MDITTSLCITIMTLKSFVPGVPSTYCMETSSKDNHFKGYTQQISGSFSHNGEVLLSPQGYIELPKSLRIGAKLDLVFDQPEKINMNGAGIKMDPVLVPQIEEVKTYRSVSKSYWEDHKAVPEGQPRISASEHTTGNTEVSIPKKTQDKNNQEPPSEPKPKTDWNAFGTQNLFPESELPGHYMFVTSFKKSTMFDLNPKQIILPPIELVSPRERPDLSQPINLEWTPVDGALAYLVVARASKTVVTGNLTENTYANWNSSRNPDCDTSAVYEPKTEAEIEQLIKEGKLLPKDKTTCSLPAGIFKEFAYAQATIYAIGLGLKQNNDNIVTRVLIKSQADVRFDEKSYEEAKTSAAQYRINTDDPRDAAAPKPQTAVISNHWVLRVDTSTVLSPQTLVSRKLSIDLVCNKTPFEKADAVCTVPSSVARDSTATLSKPAVLRVISAETADRADKISLDTYWGAGGNTTDEQPRLSSVSRELYTANSSPGIDNILGLPAQGVWYDSNWKSKLDESDSDEKSCAGNYEIFSDMCGNASFTLEKSQDFLEPIEITKVTNPVDLSEPIDIEWRSVPEAVGYFVTAITRGKDIVTIWTSSAEARKYADFALAPLSAEEVSSLVAKQVLLSKDVTRCTIPAGVFKFAGKPKITVIAIGPDKKMMLNSLQTAVVVRSSVVVPIQTKKAAGAD